MSREPRIDAYIAKAQPFARPILQHIRDRVHAVLPDAEEAIKWSMPAYMVGEKLVLITAAFKAHAALNFWRGQQLEFVSRQRRRNGPVRQIDVGRGPSRHAELDRLILEAAELAKTAPAPRKPKHAPKPAPELHPEFASALSKAPEAKAVLDGFPPSAQREYFEWVADAKQDATRQKRIATSIEWLSEGKRRNWKYENC